MTLLAAILLAVIPTPGGIGETVLVEPAVATAPAERVGNGVLVAETEPPPATQPPVPAFDDTYSNGRCVGAEALLAHYSPGWNVTRMSQVMYRESRCRPDVTSSTGCCRGLLQIHSLHIPNLGSCGVHSKADLFDPVKNICSAAIVYSRAGGMSPWAS